MSGRVAIPDVVGYIKPIMGKTSFFLFLVFSLFVITSCGEPEEDPGQAVSSPEVRSSGGSSEETGESGAPGNGRADEAEPAEEEPLRYFGVTLDVLNEDGTAEIFTKPDPDSDIVKVLPDGEDVELLETVPYGWYRVRLEDGTEGFADARTVRTETVPPHDFSPETEPGYTLVYTHTDQRLRIYHDGEQLLSAPGSSGTDELYTPRGVYRLEENRRGEWWFSEEFQVGLKYWVGFRGIWLFHSVPYTRDGKLIQEEADKLGSPASHGCIRLPPETAKYIFEMVPPGSLVLIY